MCMLMNFPISCCSTFNRSILNTVVQHRTVNLYFGARVMTDNGIVMNNEMDDFSTPGFKNAFGYDPSPENFVEPGKRPMSSSSPSIVFDSDGVSYSFDLSLISCFSKI